MSPPKTDTTERKRAGAKYKQLAETLCEQIRSGKYPVGSKLPTVLELSRQFGVGTVTAHRSIRELAEAGLVDCHADVRGTVVRRSRWRSVATRRMTIACLLRHPRPRNTSDNFGMDIMDGVRNEISARGYRMLYHCLDEPEYEQRMIELAEDSWVSGMLLDQYTPTPLVERLAGNDMPVVLYNRIVNIENVSAVSPDYEQIGRDCFRRLFERGYERLGTFASREDRPATPEMSAPKVDLDRGVTEEAKAAGVSEDRLVVIPEVYPFDPARNRPEEYGFPEHKGADWRPLGINSYSDLAGRDLMEMIVKTDLEPGRDIGLIGGYDLECNRRGPRPFDTWRVDVRMIGVNAVRELVVRIEDPSLPRTIVKMPVEFVNRGTV